MRTIKSIRFALVIIALILNAFPISVGAQSKDEIRAIILVIDKSGSMREENRMLYAREAAKNVAQKLLDADFFGIIAFDISPFIVVPLDTLSSSRDSIDKQIDRIKEGGQTYFLPALVEAKRQLEKLNFGRKHIILLSDGATRGSQVELTELVTSLKEQSQVTVSTIALGKDADLRIIKRIAQYGGGFFQLVCNPSALRQIMLNEILTGPTSDRQSKDAEQKCP